MGVAERAGNRCITPSVIGGMFQAESLLGGISAPRMGAWWPPISPYHPRNAGQPPRRGHLFGESRPAPTRGTKIDFRSTEATLVFCEF